MIFSRFPALVMALLLFSAQSVIARPGDNDTANEPYGRPIVIMSDETKQMILNEINLATAHLLLKLEEIKARFRAMKQYFVNGEESRLTAESTAAPSNSEILWAEWKNRRDLMVLLQSDFRTISQSVKATGHLNCEAPLPCQRLIETLVLLDERREELLQLKVAIQRELKAQAHRDGMRDMDLWSAKVLQGGSQGSREKQILIEKIQFVAAADVVLELIGHQ